jgi:hypothetical protein
MLLPGKQPDERMWGQFIPATLYYIRSKALNHKVTFQSRMPMRTARLGKATAQ